MWLGSWYFCPHANRPSQISTFNTLINLLVEIRQLLAKLSVRLMEVKSLISNWFWDMMIRGQLTYLIRECEESGLVGRKFLNILMFINGWSGKNVLYKTNSK